MYGTHGHGHRVMVVTPDPDLLDLLVLPLDLAGYRVRQTRDGAGALALMSEQSYDLILVDSGIPDLEDLARGRLFRPDERPPILCLTSCDHLDRIVPEVGFRVEDYVTKPCRITEVLARTQVLIRARHGGRRETMGYGDLRLDDAACRAWRGARPLDLTPAEYRMLRHLLVNAEQVLSKEQLARLLWGEARGDNAIERLVSRLRQKVDQGGPALIHTRRGFGYWLGTITGQLSTADR